VSIVGVRNAASAYPLHASALYARNLVNLLQLVVKDGAVAPDWDDEVLAGCCVTRDGQVMADG
jgi:NAD(P) transhydrogenase subunit alpha